jgi:hypothetical protein
MQKSKIFQEKQRGWGVIQRGDFNPKASIIVRSTSFGWGCAQEVRDASIDFSQEAETELKRMWIYSYIPITGKEIPELVTQWIGLLNDEMKKVQVENAPSFFEILGVFTADQLYSHEGYGYQKELDNWVVVKQLIPKRSELKPEIKWAKFMNLALYTLVRYLYRSEYIRTPPTTIKIWEKNPDLTFLETMWLAQQTTIGMKINSTFSIHTYDSLPKESIEKVLQDLTTGSILLAFGNKFYDTRLISQPLVNRMASNSGRYPNNDLMAYAMCLLDKEFAERKNDYEIMKEAITERKFPVLLELLKKYK